MIGRVLVTTVVGVLLAAASPATAQPIAIVGGRGVASFVDAGGTRITPSYAGRPSTGRV